MRWSISSSDVTCWCLEDSGVSVVVAIGDTPRSQQQVLASVRFVSNPANEGTPWLADQCLLQAHRLKRKCRTLDRLCLSPHKLENLIRPGRVLFSCEASVRADTAYLVAYDLVKKLEHERGIHFVTQSDYDQKRRGGDATGVFDSMNIKTLHSPSASGTLICFNALVRKMGVDVNKMTWSILG